MRARYVVMTGDVILLTDSTWISLEHLLCRRGGRPLEVWVFSRRAAAARVARSWNRDDLVVERVWP